jgi:CHAT domain-containing protein/tetratricopeptide (TPR) repeat protein
MSLQLFSLSRLMLLSFALGSLLLPGATAQAATSDPQQLAQEAATVLSEPIETGRAQYKQGNFSQAITTWQNAAKHYEQKGDRLNQALSLSYLSLAHQELAQWAEAQTAIDQSLQLLQASSPPAKLLAQVLNTEASLLLHRGKAEQALDRWEQAQKQYEKAQDSQGSLGSQINQAQALQQLGFNRRARQQLEAINSHLTGLPDSELKVTALRALGNALQAMGDNKGSEMLQESLTLAEKLNDKTDVSPILLSLGKRAVAEGQMAAALDYFEQAEQRTQNPTEKVQARLSQMQLLIEQGQSRSAGDRAITLARELRQELATLAPSRTTLYTTINFVATLNDLETPSQLVPLGELAGLMAKVVQSAQATQDISAEAYALNQWGKLYDRNKQPKEAQAVTARSLHLARKLQADNIISQSAWQLGRLAKSQNQTTEAIGYYKEAVQSLQAIRGDLVAVNQDMQFSYRESVEPVYRELVGLLLEGKPGQTELTQARDLVESLQVAELDNFFREACLDKARQIDQVDPTATVVYPIILPDRLAVILSTAGQPLRYYSVAQTKEATDETVGAMYRALSPVENAESRLKLSQKLYDWLIRPAEADGAFKGTKNLVFVLDGKLRNLPMAALHDGQQYLIEKYAVTLSPGLQLMASNTVKASDAKMVVGGISDARSGFAALPGVETEVRTIAKTIASDMLLNSQFTGQALSEKVQNSKANIVHLATHGQFSSRMEDTFLLTWDGKVNVKELSTMLRSREGDRAHAVELLVLSACDTAAGDDRAALGLAGLAVKSGARSTIATLWPVKDRAASLLMTEFYSNLKDKNLEKSEALRQAQIHLIQKTDFREPFFWSGVVLVGNWK